MTLCPPLQKTPRTIWRALPLNALRRPHSGYSHHSSAQALVRCHQPPEPRHRATVAERRCQAVLAKRPRLAALRGTKNRPRASSTPIDNYLAPALIGQDGGRFEQCPGPHGRCLQRKPPLPRVRSRWPLIDAVSRSLGLPCLPTAGRQAAPRPALAWTLASGDVAKDFGRGPSCGLSAKRHRIFKMKIGARAPAEDVASVPDCPWSARQSATFTVDVNQAWDRNTARRYLPATD